MGGSRVEGGNGEDVKLTDGGVRIPQQDSETELVEEEEDDKKTRIGNEKTITEDTANSSIIQMSPDKGYHATKDELDSILTNLNPILSTFHSILGDPDNTMHPEEPTAANHIPK